VGTYLYPHSTHADPTRGQRAGQIGQRTGHARVARGSERACWRRPARGSTRVARALALADLLDFGPLGSKVPQNVRFPAQDADEPPCKI